MIQDTAGEKNQTQAGTVDQDSDYNRRLFKKGIRAWFHNLRFKWLEEKCAQYSPSLDLVIELGCFDGRSLSHLGACSPRRYYGFDANWEGGLDLAKAKNKNENFHFIQCSEPESLQLNGDGKATLAIALETLEHIPEHMLENYLKKLAHHTEGYVFITVPNEKGPLFLAKHLIKKLMLKGAEEYTVAEVLWTTLGRTKHVRRNEHKGFDYDELHQCLNRFFDTVEMSGIPYRQLPLFLNAQVGFVMKSKKPAQSLDVHA